MIELYKGFACLYDCNRLINRCDLDIYEHVDVLSEMFRRILGTSRNNLRNARYAILIKESYRLLKFS